LTPLEIALTLFDREMRNWDMQSMTQRPATIRAIALTGSNTEDLEQDMKGALEAGCELSELTDALEGTDWRYIITASGTSVAVAHINDLMAGLENSLREFKLETEGLRVQDMEDTSTLEEIAQTRTRMRVARAASRHDVGANRTKRFLLPIEVANINAVDDIKRLLLERGFGWNGGDSVQEIWTEAHEQAFNSTILAHQARMTSANP
jgi:hypothetical protein